MPLLTAAHRERVDEVLRDIQIQYELLLTERTEHGGPSPIYNAAREKLGYKLNLLMLRYVIPPGKKHRLLKQTETEVRRSTMLFELGRLIEREAPWDDAHTELLAKLGLKK